MQRVGSEQEPDMTPDVTPVTAGRPSADTVLPPPPPARNFPLTSAP